MTAKDLPTDYSNERNKFIIIRITSHNINFYIILIYFFQTVIVECLLMSGRKNTRCSFLGEKLRLC